MQPVVAFINRHAVVADVHADLALVLNDPADMSHQRLAIRIEDLAQLLTRIGPQGDSLTLAYEPLINEQLFSTADVQGSIVPGLQADWKHHERKERGFVHCAVSKGGGLRCRSALTSTPIPLTVTNTTKTTKPFDVSVEGL